MIATDIFQKSIKVMNKGSVSTLFKIARNKQRDEQTEPDNTTPTEFLSQMAEQNPALFSNALDEFQRNQYMAYAALFEINTDLSFEELVNSIPTVDTEEMSTLGIERLSLKRKDNEFKVTLNLIGSEIQNNNPVVLSTLYPILIRFFEKNNSIFMEITLDKISNKYHGGATNFYQQSINYIYEWMIATVGLDVAPIDFSQVVNSLVESDDDEVAKTGQKMEMATGGNATLDAGRDDTFTLPILGDLKKLLTDNAYLFSESEQTAAIKLLLDDFIDTTEQTSELPWVALTWPDDVKSKNIKVRFNFSPQTNQPYTLLYFYQTSSGRGGMINVEDILISKYCSPIQESDEDEN